MQSIRRTQLFTKTRKDHPADETARNAQLLIQAGYINKEMAGVYAFLPLGLRVVENIKQIVREEMNAVGGQELLMTSLQPKEVWESTDRWDDEKVDVWFKSKLQDESEVGFGWSHEEPIVEMMKHHIASYKDVPANVYQFQTKLRNELRAKSGIMRGREFVMKDMYSCSTDEDEHEKFYQATIEAYNKVYERLGIGEDTYVTFASGGAFTQFSHEFQTLCDAGEDTIYVNRKKNIAINEEVLNDETMQKLGVTRDELEEVTAAEVGNIFNFGTQKSEQMDFAFTNPSGEKQFVHLGSYGIGVTRVMGVIAEKFSDDNGLVWPDNIAPFRVYLASLGTDENVVKAANELYETLQNQGISVLYDDRDVRPGQKFADADLMGIPHRVVISQKTLEKSHIEYKYRTSKDAEFINGDGLNQKLA
ncbi:MAG: aminoacyl--tRNA ligase-related protein [Candidatus Saccharibacteria bacterium]|nr:aminoacyl--tRNA ligase-related protein [Candidatus Saccharibacteria bacterium]